MFFYIALCEIKLCLLLQSRNSVPVSCIMVFCIVLCFSVLKVKDVVKGVQFQKAPSYGAFLIGDK